MTTFDGAKIVVTQGMPTQPLVGAERDEIVDLVMRLKRADERTRSVEASRPQLQAADVEWAEDWQLPREVFDYFELEHAA
ncbi:MAG: hypothetical protein EON60_05215 [Alphaproteobacteria bacterium]|nr:MAG: hypothetical protein EON60_05215 [Alphaproteobacteria bacterium]